MPRRPLTPTEHHARSERAKLRAKHQRESTIQQRQEQLITEVSQTHGIRIVEVRTATKATSATYKCEPRNDPRLSECAISARGAAVRGLGEKNGAGHYTRRRPRHLAPILCKPPTSMPKEGSRLDGEAAPNLTLQPLRHNSCPNQRPSAIRLPLPNVPMHTQLNHRKRPSTTKKRVWEYRRRQRDLRRQKHIEEAAQYGGRVRILSQPLDSLGLPQHSRIPRQQVPSEQPRDCKKKGPKNTRDEQIGGSALSFAPMPVVSSSTASRPDKCKYAGKQSGGDDTAMRGARIITWYSTVMNPESPGLDGHQPPCDGSGALNNT